MSRVRVQWVVVRATFCLFAGLTISCSEAPPPLRGVVIVSLDTLRADRLGFAGYSRATTPFLDALASHSLVFDTALAQAPWTLPSHAAMLTSMYPSVLGLGDYPKAGRIPRRAVLLAELLQAQGFRTHAETAGGFVSGGLGFSRGFEHYEDRPRRFPQSLDRVLTWLAELEPQERFFVFLHTYDIHTYDPPGWAREQLVDAAELPADLRRELERARSRGVRGLAELMQNPFEAEAIGRLGPEARAHLSQLYDASILAADRQLERLVVGLDGLGLLRDTLLIVTSDHGEELFDHGRTGHGFTLYDENLRVPLLLSHASLPAARVASPVRLLDLAPTVADLLGVEAPAEWQGRSLFELVDGDAEDALVFAEGAHRPLRGVRDADFKFIRDRSTQREWLFDLRSDPGETRNLLGGNAANETRLRAALDAWQRDTLERRLQSEAEPQVDADLARQLEALGYLDPKPEP